jgi:uncharacterized membrane protein YhaH (DUF805 family)
MDIKNLLLSYKGRIRRMHFWLGYVGAAIVYGVLSSIIGMVLHPTVDATTGVMTMNPIAMVINLILYVVFAYVVLAVAVKRMHDRDKSGWWVLVPIYNIIVCGFLPGTPGPNRFGPDPKGADAAPAAAA